jgi:nicotinate-nucleotide adenylyltransferase
MPQQIGIYSGTFDPVHSGHIAFAKGAVQDCGLDSVVFLPERTPRDKQNVTALAHRLALLERATAQHPELHVRELESDQFTVQQTLPEIRRLVGDAELMLLVGSDVVRTFAYRWPGLDELLQSVQLVIGMREGDDKSDIAAIIQTLEQDLSRPIRHTYIYTAQATIASSPIRTGERSDWLPTEVSRYINRHGLYR